MLSLLKPKSVPGIPLVRVGRDMDGGYVMLDSGLDRVPCYNFGIAQETSWDADMVKRGCQVLQYDHTVDSSPALTDKSLGFSVFHKIGVGAVASDDGPIETIGNLLRQNNHLERDDLIMNMDIEGCEWDILNSVDEDHIRCFFQIVIELHNILTPTKDKISAIEKLLSTHTPIHVHGNNCGRIENGMPDTLEVTLIRSDMFILTECNDTFPRVLDRPNTPVRPDYFLGKIGL